MPPASGVRVKLDRVRTLRLGWRALEKLQEEHGISVEDLGAQLQTGQFKTIRLIIWAGLIHEDPDLTFDQTADLMDQADFTELVTAASELITSRFGGGEPEGNSKAATAKKRTTKKTAKARRKPAKS